MADGFSLERTVLIHAERSLVFSFFTRSALFERWWGAGSTIDPTPGGELRICYPNGIVAGGEVREVVADERIVFTYGFESGKPMGPGESLVSIELEDDPAGTLLRLRHEVADETVRDAHVAGWRYQLAVFAKVASDEQFAGADATVDEWFACWTEESDEERHRRLAAITDAEIEFRDAFGVTSGVDDLAGHITAARVHLKAVSLERRGDLRRCHGVALADFEGAGSDGAVALGGTSVFEFAPGGKIRRVVGL